MSKIEIPYDMKEDSQVDETAKVETHDTKLTIDNTNKLASASFGNVNSDTVESSLSVSRPQSAGGRLDVSGNITSKGHIDPPAIATVVNTASKEGSVVKESTPRKISAPPLHLLNLFEPLRTTVSPHKLTVDGTPQHQIQRPMSMIVQPTHNDMSHSLFTGSSSLVPSATVSSSLSAIGSLPVYNEMSSRKNDVLNEQDEEEKSDHEDGPDKHLEVDVPQELDIRKDELKDDSIEIKEPDVQHVESPKQDLLTTRSHNTSVSSEGSENVSIVRVPSHPDLRFRPQLTKVDSLDSSPIMRARSVNQLQQELDRETSLKRRAYSGSRDTVPGFAGLMKDNSQMRQSLDKLRSAQHKGTPSRLPLSHQNSPCKMEKERVGRRISADPERERVHSAGSRGRGRPKSMIETGSYAYYRNPSMDFVLAASQDFLGQLFWTSVSLLESDYENEYYLAQHLFGKVISQLDLTVDSTYTRLEMIQQKIKADKFPGIQKLLLKGLTLVPTTKSTRELLSIICPHANRWIFDPSNFKGLPMNIIGLLPELVLHFDKHNENAQLMAGTISKVSLEYINSTFIYICIPLNLHVQLYMYSRYNM